jgi:MFS family permease
MSATPELPQRKTPRKAAFASFLGSVVEYYDFFIYGSAAALVFPTVFFPDMNGVAGTLASMATFAVAWVARPFGSFFLGHYGDKIGRKRVLVFTLLLMGVSTFLIGCLPSYASIGTLAPVLLVILRIMQGLSAAGEQSGASSLTLEHSPEGARGYFTSFTLSGTQAGLVIATLAFIPVAALPDDALYSWGWRVPFWASAVVVAVAFFVRRRIAEPPTFAKLQQANEVVKFPITVFARYYWKSFFRIIFCHFYGITSTAVTVFGLAYATKQWGIPKSSLLWTIVIANIIAIVSIPMWGKLSDRVGRRPVFAAGALGAAILIFFYFYAITTKNVWLVGAATALLSGIVYSAPNAVWPSLYAEIFDARVRYTGMAVSTQFANVALGLFPSIAVVMMKPGALGWIAVAVLLAGLNIIAAIAAFAGKETAFTPLDDLGGGNTDAITETIRTSHTRVQEKARSNA